MALKQFCWSHKKKRNNNRGMLDGEPAFYTTNVLLNKATHFLIQDSYQLNILLSLPFFLTDSQCMLYISLSHFQPVFIHDDCISKIVSGYYGGLQSFKLGFDLIELFK